MKFSNFSALLCVGAILLLLSGCNDKPDPVGIDSLPSKDIGTIHVDTISATQHKAVKFIANTKYVDRVMLGINNSNGLKYKAWTCLRFFQWPDTLLNSITIDSAFIQLKTNYKFGDTTTQLNFSVYSAAQNWDADSLNLPGAYYEKLLAASYSENSDGWLTINIRDTSKIREWFISNSDTNKGIILEPNDVAGSNLIKGFYSSNSINTSTWPKLTIKYKKNGYTGVYTHTNSNSRYVADVTPTTVFDADSMIYVQNGIAYHGHVWFNSFLLPSKSSIFGATLEVTLDASSSPVYLYENLYASRTQTDGTIDWNYLVYEGYPSSIGSGKRLYKFDITDIVTAWQNGNTIPKLVIYGKNQNLSFDLFKLYGSGSNIYKPRIIITYFKKS